MVQQTKASLGTSQKFRNASPMESEVDRSFQHNWENTMQSYLNYGEKIQLSIWDTQYHLK